MAFEESLREKIINFSKLKEVLDKIGKKKRDVLRLLANLTLSKNFDVKIIVDRHIEEAFEAIRIPEYYWEKDTKEKTVSLTCISCLCVILNLTSKGEEINTTFLNLGLTRHLCNMIQSNISDQKVVPLSFMILANLMTYKAFPDKIFNETIDMLKMIHEMSYLKVKKDTKYNPEDKIFNKIFFLLSYSRFNLNCLLQGLMEKIKIKINIEKYFEVFFEIFLNVDLIQNNLILISGRIIYYMIMNSDRLYDILVKKDSFYKRIIQIISGADFENVIKGKFEVLTNEKSKEKSQTDTDRAKRLDGEEMSIPRPGEDVILDEKEKAASQSRMIAFLLLRLISKKEKSTNIFFYKGMDNLIRYIYILFHKGKITDEEKESIILFYSNIISSKQVLEKLHKTLKLIITNFQRYFHPLNSQNILLACIQFFLQLSKNSHHHIAIAKKTFLSNMAIIYRKPHPRLRQLIQILLSNLSFSPKTHLAIIRAQCHQIIESLDEKEDELKKYMNVSKLNMALNYKTFVFLRDNPGPLISLPLMNHINPVGQIKLYLSALQYLVREGPKFIDTDKIDLELFPEFSDPNKHREMLWVVTKQETEKQKRVPIIRVLETCFSKLIESLTNQSVYIINRAVYLCLLLINHPYLEEVTFNAPALLIVICLYT